MIQEQDGVKKFVPAIDETAFRKGSELNDHLKQRLKKKELMTRIHQAAEECTVLINKNQSEKLLNFLRSLDYELKLNIIED